MKISAHRLFAAGLLALLLLNLQACTQRAWFDGFVAGQKYQCNRLDGRERAACLESIRDDFDRYQQQREEYLQRNR